MTKQWTPNKPVKASTRFAPDSEETMEFFGNMIRLHEGPLLQVDPDEGPEFTADVAVLDKRFFSHNRDGVDAARVEAMIKKEICHAKDYLVDGGCVIYFCHDGILSHVIRMMDSANLKPINSIYHHYICIQPVRDGRKTRLTDAIIPFCVGYVKNAPEELASPTKMIENIYPAMWNAISGYSHRERKAEERYACMLYFIDEVLYVN